DGTATRPIGEAGYAVRSDGDGDLAVTVAGERRGWLGGFLLDRIVQHARDVGLENLQAEVLLENRPMLALLRHRGAVDLEHDDGVVRVAIPTDGSIPSWAPLDERPHLLVEVAGSRWSGEDAARRAGHSVAICSGPERRRGGCPELDGRPCPLVEGANAVVVVRDPEDPTTHALIRAHHERRSDVPVVVRRAELLPDELADIVVDVPGGADDVVQWVSGVGRDPSDASPEAPVQPEAQPGEDVT
ncbi:MAG: hypothetical protein AAFP84_20275, partial [Actinomycetota bacterium]